MSEPRLRSMTVEEFRESNPDIDQNGNFTINEVVYVPEEKYKKLLEFVSMLSMPEHSQDELNEMRFGKYCEDALLANRARILLKEIGELND